MKREERPPPKREIIKIPTFSQLYYLHISKKYSTFAPVFTSHITTTMKKILSLLAFVAIALAFTSCDPKVDNTIKVNIATIGESRNVTFWNGTPKHSRFGYWVLMAADTTYAVVLRNGDKVYQVEGEYPVSKLHSDSAYILRLADSTKIHFTSGKLTLVVDDGGDRVIAKGKVIGSDNNAYELRIVFQAPYAFVTKEIKVKNAYVNESLAKKGLFGMEGSAADSTGNNYYLQLFWQSDTIVGTFYRCDLYDPYCGITEINSAVSLDASDIYSANFQVLVDTTKVYYNVVGKIQCYNNTLYKIDMKALKAPQP